MGKDPSVLADNAPYSSLSRDFLSVLTEERENEKKLNIILYNVPESTNSSSAVRKQDDADATAAIYIKPSLRHPLFCF